jgi:hypothetical protein
MSAQKGTTTKGLEKKLHNHIDRFLLSKVIGKDKVKLMNFNLNKFFVKFRASKI